MVACINLILPVVYITQTLLGHQLDRTEPCRLEAYTTMSGEEYKACKMYFEKDPAGGWF